jgi:hypothetical protein
MTTNLLTSPQAECSKSTNPSDSTSSPERERVRLLVIASKGGVTNIIHSLHRLGFADAGDWSRFVPAQNEGEVMSVLSKYVVRR